MPDGLLLVNHQLSTKLKNKAKEQQSGFLINVKHTKFKNVCVGGWVVFVYKFTDLNAQKFHKTSPFGCRQRKGSFFDAQTSYIVKGR